MALLRPVACLLLGLRSWATPCYRRFIPPGRLTIVQLTGFCPAVGTVRWVSFFWMSLMGYPPSQLVLAIIGVLAAAGWVALKNKSRLLRIRLVANDLDEGDGWIVVPLAVILGMVTMMVVVAVSSPLSEWDAFSIWGLKAKVLAYEALRPTRIIFMI